MVKNGTLIGNFYYYIKKKILQSKYTEETQKNRQNFDFCEIENFDRLYKIWNNKLLNKYVVGKYLQTYLNNLGFRSYINNSLITST